MWGTEYKIHPTDYRWKYFFHLLTSDENFRSMEVNRVTPIALHGEKEKLADFFYSMKLGEKTFFSGEDISGCNTVIL